MSAALPSHVTLSPAAIDELLRRESAHPRKCRRCRWWRLHDVGAMWCVVCSREVEAQWAKVLEPGPR